jgi:AraC-like DNA-binding protein
MDELPSTAVADLPIHMRHMRRGTICATDDFDVYRGAINDTYYPARFEIVGERRQLSNARMSAVRLGSTTVGIVHNGADILIDPGDVGGYHIDLPLHGSVDTSCGTQSVVATPARAAVYTPNEHTFVSRWRADATQVSIKIDRAALEHELARILGRPVSRRIEFDIGFDLTLAGARRWRSTLQILIDTMTDPGTIPDSALTAQIGCLERALIIGLLTNQRHSATDALRDSPTSTDPAALRKVVELVTAAPGAQYTMTDLAAAAGIGVRQLQKLFHERFDMSPSEYLRSIRLEGTRTDLLRHEPGTTVSDIAFRWGFNHLGRYAQYYERKFGESPSRTLHYQD